MRGVSAYESSYNCSQGSIELLLLKSAKPFTSQSPTTTGTKQGKPG